MREWLRFVVLAVCSGWAAWGMAARAQAVPSRGRSRPVEILREIDDPATGNRWLLEKDEESPGGPGRMVLSIRGNMTPLHREHGGRPVTLPVIHAGDRIVLVAHTAVMDAELEAVALAPAAVGSSLRVRLKMGGKVLEAVALGPGKAEGYLESGATP